MSKPKVFGIFGLGSFGYQICESISNSGGKVIAFDNDEKIIEKIKDSVTQAILMDSADEEALKNSPIDNIDIAVVAIGNNMQSSIITTALLKKYNIPYIISRATSDIHYQLLKQIGANEVVNLEIEEGKRIANKLISPNILERIPLSKNFIFAELRIPRSLIGKTLQKLDLRNKYNINVISIKRISIKIDEIGNPFKEDIIIFPKPQDVFMEDDILFIVGLDNDVEIFKEL